MRGTNEIPVLHQEFTRSVIQPTSRVRAYIEPSLNFFIITIKQDGFIFAVNVGINDDYFPIRQICTRN